MTGIKERLAVTAQIGAMIASGQITYDKLKPKYKQLITPITEADEETIRKAEEKRQRRAAKRAQRAD